MKWDAKLLLVAVTVGGVVIAKFIDEDRRRQAGRGSEDMDVWQEILR